MLTIHQAVTRSHVVSTDDGSPMVLDTCTAAQFAFAMAGIDLDTKGESRFDSHFFTVTENGLLDVVDNHLAALGTGLEGHLTVDEAEEVEEKQKATEIFYVGVKPEEAPGQFHAPLIDETSGYGNYREGMDEFPDMWQPDTKRTGNSLIRTSRETQAKVFAAAKGPKNILKPKSRKAPKNDIHMAGYDSTDSLSRTIFTPPIVQAVYTDTLIKGMFKFKVSAYSLPSSSLLTSPKGTSVLLQIPFPPKPPNATRSKTKVRIPSP